MGKGNNRRSQKMKNRRSQVRLKLRLKRIVAQKRIEREGRRKTKKKVEVRA